MKSKTTKQPISEQAKNCRKYFYEQYEKVKERPYNASFQKDAMLFSKICNRFPEPWVKGMIDFYLQWKDEFVKSTGYTIGVFFSKVNQMLELGIHKSEWVRKHEKSKMKPISDIMKKMGYGGKK